MHYKSKEKILHKIKDKLSFYNNLLNLKVSFNDQNYSSLTKTHPTYFRPTRSEEPVMQLHLKKYFLVILHFTNTSHKHM